MDAYQKYNHFASGYGAGRDKFGHMVFGGQGYVSPSEKGKMLAHMNKLGADVAAANQSSAAAQQNAFQQRAMRMQDEDRAFQRSLADRNYDIENRKMGILQGLIRKF